MLFEAGSVKAGGGENWIPLCLPGFNNTGFLYMYVSFLDFEHPSTPMHERPRSQGGSDTADEVAILLISANKEGFYELRGMRDDLVHVCITRLFRFRTRWMSQDYYIFLISVLSSPSRWVVGWTDIAPPILRFSDLSPASHDLIAGVISMIHTITLK
jgi:hypothetical protein